MYLYFRLSSESGKVLVTAAVVYHASKQPRKRRQLSPSIQNNETTPNEWMVLDAFMKKNLVTVLSLNQNETRDLIIFNSDKQEVGYSWNNTEIFSGMNSKDNVSNMNRLKLLVSF